MRKITGLSVGHEMLQPVREVDGLNGKECLQTASVALILGLYLEDGRGKPQ